MRIGTFACWLFGHKFTETHWRDGAPHILKGLVLEREKVYYAVRTDYCVRCGVSQPTSEKEAA